ncbi:MAG: class I SAM-dependent methyltransferase [Rhodocyclaceae bacterium]|nr:class I SAM-dependent methyltransferase [Rhodocyclaceae bacterium]
MSIEAPEAERGESWDHGSDPHFLRYYEEESISPKAIERFTVVRDKALRLFSEQGGVKNSSLTVADIGCGAGTQCRLWATLGHRVYGLDVNAPLLEVARRRSRDDGLDIAFDVGSATALPWADASMDVCLLPELLEHVADWQGCLDEAVRVLKPGGLLYLSTNNWLCPVQQEFNLPLYSWYPGFIKRKCEKLAVTSRPDIANFATYPAVNWFTVYSLTRYLRTRGFRCLDRFDVMDTSRMGRLPRFAVALLRQLPPLRLVGHVLTPHSLLFAFKERHCS